MNPPSAWAVAKRDAPQIAEQCWTHGMPAGPEGPLRAVPPVLLGHLEFQQEQVGGQEPADPPFAARGDREDGGGQRRLRPAVLRATDTLKVWAEEGPPKGTLYHYPNPYNHQILSIAAAPSPPKIAQQIYTQAIHDQDDRTPSAGRADGEDADLGGKRDRRLHAQLGYLAEHVPMKVEPFAVGGSSRHLSPQGRGRIARARSG